MALLTTAWIQKSVHSRNFRIVFQVLLRSS